MTFRIFGVAPASVEKARLQGGVCSTSFAANCEGCGDPISGIALSKLAKDTYPNFPNRAFKLVSEKGSLHEFSFEVLELWPKPTAPRVPDHLPASVERAFLQGELTYAMAGCEDAAAMMYRSALEMALKELHPEAKGMLGKRIDAAVAKGHLPNAIGDWAHEVKIVGNDSAHELEGTTRSDLEEARGLVDAALRYLFSMPQTVAERRERRAVRELFDDAGPSNFPE